ncbi:hypothetical protein [Candidatus Poriferisodalis sp.]|uniref:hypothetical protein n=1 Tax=Candidatus Poriferisodalis sp. TaxID=3101277 RepID=UPI003B01D231
MGLIYANTLAVAVVLAAAAALPLTFLAAQRILSPESTPVRDRVSRRGRLSDWLSDHLNQIVSVILPLVTAALVAIAFLHETLRDVPSEALWTPSAASWFLGSREGGLCLVYLGVAGLMFAIAGFAAKGIEPDRGSRVTPKLRWVFWKLSVRWCARAAGLAALGVVLLVPALLSMLVAALEVPSH